MWVLDNTNASPLFLALRYSDDVEDDVIDYMTDVTCMVSNGSSTYVAREPPYVEGEYPTIGRKGIQVLSRLVGKLQVLKLALGVEEIELWHQFLNILRDNTTIKELELLVPNETDEVSYSLIAFPFQG